MCMCACVCFLTCLDHAFYVIKDESRKFFFRLLLFFLLQREATLVWKKGGGRGRRVFKLRETTLLHFATNRACVNSLFAMPRPDFADGN